MVSRKAAIKDAIADAPWSGAATGISLVIAVIDPNRRSSLAWLVSIRPRARVYRVGGSAPTRKTAGSTSPGPAANYFVVAISARTGRFITASDGYSPSLARP